jgi:hypothetical protein
MGCNPQSIQKQTQLGDMGKTPHGLAFFTPFMLNRCCEGNDIGRDTAMRVKNIQCIEDCLFAVTVSRPLLWTNSRYQLVCFNASDAGSSS